MDLDIVTSRLEEIVKDGEEATEWIRAVFNRPKQPDKTYHHIKRFEEKLRELPWQEDMKAIYEGSGRF